MELRETTNLLTRLFYSLLTNHEGTNMAQSKAPNYSDEAVARLEAVYTEASTDEQRKNAVVILANELGKTPASVIAKLVSMGIYVKGSIERATPAKRPETKAQIVLDISGELAGFDEATIKGLAKADRLSLIALRDRLVEMSS